MIEDNYLTYLKKQDTRPNIENYDRIEKIRSNQVSEIAATREISNKILNLDKELEKMEQDLEFHNKSFKGFFNVNIEKAAIYTKLIPVITELYNQEILSKEIFINGLDNLLKDSGIPLFLQHDKNPKYYSITEIAKLYGITTRYGKPHKQAIKAIINKIKIKDYNKALCKYINKGQVQNYYYVYDSKTVELIMNWLKENNFPNKISEINKNGNFRNYYIVYEWKKYLLKGVNTNG